MFESFADDTPNAHKVSIMLEEIKADYKVTLIDIGKGDPEKKEPIWHSIWASTTFLVPERTL